MTLTTEQIKQILEGAPEGKFYAERDAYELDVAGNYYTKHVSAMTSEKLHSKSDIAAELACRDLAISTLRQRLDELEQERDYALNKFHVIADKHGEPDSYKCVVYDMEDPELKIKSKLKSMGWTPPDKE